VSGRSYDSACCHAPILTSKVYFRVFEITKTQEDGVCHSRFSAILLCDAYAARLTPSQEASAFPLFATKIIDRFSDVRNVIAQHSDSPPQLAKFIDPSTQPRRACSGMFIARL
jgi:hypothetical protein